MSVPSPSPDGTASAAEDFRSVFAGFAGEDFGLRAWLRLLRDLYCSFDRRTLGFTRILLGFLLLTDLIHRGATWQDMYSSSGVLPAPLHLLQRESPSAFTVFNAFVSPGELSVLWAIMVANAACLLIGYRTKLTQVLALVLHTGLNGRLLLVENGGYIVQNLLLLWTAFLPLGDRFSADALLASLRRRRETTAEELNDRGGLLSPGTAAPYVSLCGLAVTAQIAAIYYFNVVHKTGPEWQSGTAVHYVLYIDRMATPLTVALRDHLPGALVVFMTRATMVFEATIPVLLLQPLSRTWSLRIVILLICTLHLAFGVTFVLGPFAWSACVFSTLLFSRDDWEIAAATMLRTRRARTVLFDPRSGGALLACRLLARLDRFQLLTFSPREGLPLGLGASGQESRSGMLADLVEALPLGPTVAWIGRLPGVRWVLEAGLAFVEKRDVSGFFGLRVGPHSPPPAASSTFRSLGRVALGSARELAVLAMIVASIDEAMIELWSIHRRLHVAQPEALRLLTRKMRFLQGWFMFAPRPPLEDGTIVVDALTVDGRHIDPFTGKPPSWDLRHGGLRLTQVWSDYFSRIRLPAAAGYREAMKDYLYRLPERSGRPEDALVSGEVVWVNEHAPRWNEHRGYGYGRERLLSFENPAARPQTPRSAR